jgi:ADP-dependent NAD(P)H-hydrate dehydratase / NAD(P)H-hydrate epimerase
VDADGLNLLAALNPMQRDNWVLTPHPGEAARLLGSTSAEVQQDRLAAVRALAHRYAAVTVLKGACTLIAEPEGPGAAAGRGMGL